MTITLNPCLPLRNSGGVVVKLLACGARGPGSTPGLAATISEIVYLRFQVRKEQIWLSRMTKAPSPTEKSKKQCENTKTLPKLWLHNDCGPT